MLKSKPNVTSKKGSTGGQANLSIFNLRTVDSWIYLEYDDFQMTKIHFRMKILFLLPKMVLVNLFFSFPFTSVRPLSALV